MSSLTVKGFVGNAAKVNNAFDAGRGIVAMFGELSPDSKTFAKELGYYPKANSPLFTVTFTCHDENDVRVALPDEHNALIREVYEWVYAQGRLNPAPTLYELIYKFNLAFNGRQITEIDFGELAGDGEVTLPWYVGLPIRVPTTSRCGSVMSGLLHSTMTLKLKCCRIWSQWMTSGSMVRS